MDRLGVALGVIALSLTLFGVLIVLQRKRNRIIPEGFTTEYQQDPTINTISNPITKTLKQIGHLTVYFANPLVWKDAIDNSKLSITDLARKQIELDKKKAAEEKASEQ